MADRKSRQMFHRARKLNPDAIVVGAGCYVQTKEAQALVDETIDIVIGNNRKHELIRLLEEYEKSHVKTKSIADINHEKQEYEELSLKYRSADCLVPLPVAKHAPQQCYASTQWDNLLQTHRNIDLRHRT